MRPEDIIIKPIITEKSNDGLQDGKYTFKVNKKALTVELSKTSQTVTYGSSAEYTVTFSGFVNSETVETIDSLKVLCIGNSFSVDTIEHVPNIALNMNIKSVKFGNLYIGGCSINKHYNNAVNNIASYEYFVNDGNGWTSSYNHSILSVLKSENWDYISIQAPKAVARLCYHAAS